MKKLIPLFTALVLTFGAVTAFAGMNTKSPTKATGQKTTKSKTKKATKS